MNSSGVASQESSGSNTHEIVDTEEIEKIANNNGVDDTQMMEFGS